MDNKATTKRMIGAVVLVLVAALLLAWLLKGKNRDMQNGNMQQTAETKPILGFPSVNDQKPILVNDVTTQSADNAAGTQAQQAATTGGDTAAQQAADAQGAASGLAVRPNESGEVRNVVDTDGTVKAGTGNMGATELKPPPGPAPTNVVNSADNKAPADTQPMDLPKSETQTASAGNGNGSATQDTGAKSASQSAAAKDKADADKSTVITEEKKASKPVLVGEKPVPKADSADNSAAKAKAAADKAAAEKSIALKTAADKAAAEKAKAASAAGAAASGSSAASTTGGYTIQLVASSDKAKAESVRKAMSAEGYKVIMSEAKVDGKVIYRVRIGDYPKKEDAAAMQAKMKARYTQNEYVKNSFVTR